MRFSLVQCLALAVTFALCSSSWAIDPALKAAGDAYAKQHKLPVRMLEVKAGDRVYKLGGGIPSAAVPIFQPEAITLLIGGGGGATTVNPNLTLPRDRTYWVQE